jgi:hypothetical protein
MMFSSVSVIGVKSIQVKLLLSRSVALLTLLKGRKLQCMLILIYILTLGASFKYVSFPFPIPTVASYNL